MLFNLLYASTYFEKRNAHNFKKIDQRLCWSIFLIFEGIFITY